MPKTRPRDLANARSTNSLSELLRECRATDHDRGLAVAMPPLVHAIEVAAQFSEPFRAILENTPFSAVGIVAEVPDHRRAEKAARLRELALEAPSQGVTIIDPTKPGNPIVYANAGFLRLMGYELDDVISSGCTFLLGCDTDAVSRAQVSEAIHNGQSQTIVLSNHRKDGTSFWDELSISPKFDADGRLTNIVGTHNDVTQRKQLEELHRQSHKMEAIGQLANGIAHDFNNLLTVIIAYAELLVHSRAFDGPALDSLAEISKAGEQAACLTRQLQVFSTNRPASPVLINWNSVIRDMEDMLRRVLGEDVEVSTVLQPGLQRVPGDPSQLSQALLDLCLNARNAMPYGGKLLIETRNVELSGDAAGPHSGGEPGEYVLLSVTHVGARLPRETMDCEMGSDVAKKRQPVEDELAMFDVQRMVAQSRGHIEVEDVEVENAEGESGVGTTIKLYLPSAEAAATKKTPLSVHSKFPQGNESILLVEDETAVRELCRKILEKCGYTVLEAHSSESALRVAEEYREPIHLLVMDVVLPGAGGCSLAGQLQAIQPKSRVLFMSGRLDSAAIRHGTKRETIEFLAKPFTPFALAQKVRDVLNRF